MVYTVFCFYYTAKIGIIPYPSKCFSSFCTKRPS